GRRSQRRIGQRTRGFSGPDPPDRRYSSCPDPAAPKGRHPPPPATSRGRLARVRYERGLPVSGTEEREPAPSVDGGSVGRLGGGSLGPSAPACGSGARSSSPAIERLKAVIAAQRDELVRHDTA